VRAADRFVVPANPPNKAVAAEAGEERERTKGNTAGETRPGRSAGSGVSSELGRVREVAQKDRNARFTALLHHVSLGRLVMAYWDLSPKAAPGVDGVTWEAYGQDLVANLRDLHARVQQGRYRASPSRRAYIPKADGRQRPLGIVTPGGQDRPAGRRRGAQRHLRGGASGVSRTGSGRGAARIRRWMRWRPGSRPGG
jgi:RNA-directed DNA polymerase